MSFALILIRLGWGGKGIKYLFMSNPIKIFVVAGTILKRDGKYLLVQERKPNIYGLWNIPTGKIEEGEIVEQTAIREAKEETGYEIVLKEKIGVYHERLDLACKHIFTGDIIGGEFKYQEEELLGADWFTYDEIMNMKDRLRDPSVWKAIEASEKNRAEIK